MEELYPKRNILAIDLKSFFASCECVERKLDPYKVPLIVCDPTRNGAITLAVTPFLKKFGVPGRCRVFELYKYNLPKITFHELRHTCATLLNSQGVDPVTIKERLGHSNINITLDIYTHALEQNKKDSVNVFAQLQNNTKNTL